MKTQIILAFVILLSLFNTSCSKPEEEYKEIEISEKSKEIIAADNAFGMDIFKLIAEKETEPNFMISPLSISMALSMAYNGAETNTEDEMAEALRITDFTREEINVTYQKLIEALTSVDPKVAMEIANSIWYKEDYPVEQTFLDVNSKYFDAEVNKGDFYDPEMVDVINNWVSDKTHKKIPTIIDQIDPATVMFIINAIYFNGNWAQEFNKENTYTGVFNLSNTDHVEAELMQRLDTVNYFENEAFSAIELPYGQGNFNMMLLLPNYEKSVDVIIEQLNASNWTKWQNDFEITNEVDIVLPKFKIEYDKKLKDIMQLMGMNEAFTTLADFSSINPQKDLFISEILHKTFIEVDEEGTEAAAVTALIFDTTSIGPDKPQKKYFHCTRPFLFAITEKETGAILFMGKVGKPESAD